MLECCVVTFNETLTLESSPVATNLNHSDILVLPSRDILLLFGILIKNIRERF